MIEAGIELDSAGQIQSGLQVDEMLWVGGQSLRTTSDLGNTQGDSPPVNGSPAQTQSTAIRFASVLGVRKLSVKQDSIGKEFGYRLTPSYQVPIVVVEQSGIQRERMDYLNTIANFERFHALGKEVRIPSDV
jgi:hypothetical protein